MKRLLGALLLLSACKSVPKCENYLKEQSVIRAVQGLTPYSKGREDYIAAAVWRDLATMEADGIMFFYPEHPQYDQADLALPKQKELGTCKEGDQELRIVGFHVDMPPQDGDGI